MRDVTGAHHMGDRPGVVRAQRSMFIETYSFTRSFNVQKNQALHQRIGCAERVGGNVGLRAIACRGAALRDAAATGTRWAATIASGLIA